MLNKLFLVFFFIYLSWSHVSQVNAKGKGKNVQTAKEKSRNMRRRTTNDQRQMGTLGFNSAASTPEDPICLNLLDLLDPHNDPNYTQSSALTYSNIHEYGGQSHSNEDTYSNFNWNDPQGSSGALTQLDPMHDAPFDNPSFSYNIPSYPNVYEYGGPSSSSQNPQSDFSWNTTYITQSDDQLITQNEAQQDQDELELVRQYILDEPFNEKEVADDPEDYSAPVPEQFCSQCYAKLGIDVDSIVHHTKMCKEIAKRKTKFFGCYACPHETHKKYNMAKHIERHIRPYKCELCPFSSAYSRGLENHMNTSHFFTTSTSVVRDQVCNMCDKILGTDEAHILQHTKICKEIAKRKKKKFGCYRCKYECDKSDSMKRHIRVHTQNKPYKCPICPYTASQRTNIIPHLKNVHKVDVNKILKECRKKNKNE